MNYQNVLFWYLFTLLFSNVEIKSFFFFQCLSEIMHLLRESCLGSVLLKKFVKVRKKIILLVAFFMMFCDI